MQRHRQNSRHQSRSLSRRRATAVVLGVAAAGWSSHAFAANGTWNGLTDGNWSTANGTGNWGTLTAAPGANTGFTSADVATFSYITSTSFSTITVDSGRNVKGITFDNTFPPSAAPAYTLTGSPLLLTSGGTLQTTSLVAVTETVGVNLFLEGASATTAGAYTFTDSSALNSGLGSLDITGNISGDTGNTTSSTITLTFNGSNLGVANISGAITNGGAGAGLGISVASGSNATWILSGANTYSGPTAINGGTVDYANSSAISANSAVTVNGGDVVFGAGVTLPASNFTLTSGGLGYGGGIQNSTFLTFVNNLTIVNLLNTSLLIDSASDASTNINFNTLGAGLGANNNATSMALGANGNFTYSGTITPNSSLGYRLGGGSGSLTLAQPLTDANGPGTPVTVISGAGGNVVANPSSTYTGVTTINSGAILIATKLVTENSGGGTASSLGASGNAATNVVLNAGTLRYTGGTASTDRGITLNTSGSIDASGTGPLTLNGSVVPSVSGNNTLTLTGGGSGVLSAAYADNGSDIGALTKAGTGTWILAAADNYSGTTTLSAGVLDIGNAGALGTGTLGTFAVNGGSFDNTTNAPLTVNNNETWGGNFTFIGSNSFNSGTGTVSLTGTRTVTILSSSVTIPGLVSNSTAGFGITKQGLGTLTLLNSGDSYTGTTSVNGGLLSLGTTGSIGGSAISISNGEFSISGVGLGSARSMTTTGALTDNTGTNVVTLNTDSGQAVTFTAGSLAARAQGGIELYRGPNLGVDAPGGNGANILFTSAPAVTNTGTTATALGSFDSTSGNTTLGVANAPVLRAALIDNTSATGTGVGFATYDPTNGVRLLNPSTEQYLITTGSANTYALATTDDNVRIGSSVANPLTALTITGKSTNTLQLDNTNGSTAMTITNSGTALFPVNGLLFSGSAPITLTGGSLSFTNNSGANNDMVIMSTDTATVTISATLASSGSNQKSYTFGGPGNFAITVTPATSSSGGVFFDGPGTATLTTNSWGPSSTGLVVNGGTVVFGTGFGLSTSVTRPAMVAAGATLNILNASIASTTNAGLDALNNVNGVGGTVTNATVGTTTAVLTNLPLSLDNSAGNFAGTITGMINLVIAKQGSTSTTNTQILTGPNTYAGSTLVTSNSVLAGQTTAVLQIGTGGSLPSTTVVTLGGGFATSGTVVTTDSGVLVLGDANGPSSQTIGGLATAGTGTGPTASEVVAGNALNSTLTVNNSGSPTIFAGTLGGPTLNQNNLAFVKSGTAAQTLSGANTYTGGTIVNGGTLKIDNTTGSGTGSGAVIVNSNATIAGTGAIAGAVTVNSGGHLDPGDNALANLTIGSAGSLTLNGGSILDFDFTNTSSDEVIDNGSLALLGTAGTSTGNSAGVGINVYSSGTNGKFTPTGSGSETFNLFQFAGAAPAVNTLSVLNPVGGDGYSFDINSNDVQLVVTFPPTSVWTDSASDQTWSTPSDWSTNPTVPNTAGASITFPNLASHPMTVNLNGNKTVGAISFTTGAAYTISASSGTLTLDNAGSNSAINVSGANGSSTTQSINAPISLAGTSSPVLDAVVTTATSNDILSLAGQITGNGGILATGSGTVALNGNNSYLGGTTINGGIVQINSATSLGAVSGAAAINSGTLEVLNSITTSRSFQLGSATSTIQIDGGGTYEIDGNITDVSPTSLGTLNLTIPGGSGTLILTGTNTYSGGTNIPANAVLQLGNTAGTVGASMGAAGTLTNNGTINVGASMGSPLASSTTVSIPTNLSGTGPLNQFGGTLALAGSNANFSGPVTIINGTLSLGSASSTGSGTGNLAITNSEITETASGTIGNNSTSGTAATGISTLTLTGALTIDTGGANNMTIATQLFGATGTTITRTAGTGTLSLGIAGNTNFSNGGIYLNAFAGTFTNNIGAVTLLSRGSGSNAAQFNFNAGSAYTVTIGGIGGSINFGSLSGNQPIANLNSVSAGRLVVGNLGTINTTYSGVIGSANGAGAAGLGLLKVGSGSLTLTGQNLYAGQALTAVVGVPTVVQSGTLIAASNAAPDNTYGPLGPTTPTAAGTGPNYVLIGSNGTLSSASLLAAGVTVANPIVVSGGGATATTSAYTLTLGGNNTTGASSFTGAVTLENNLTLSQSAGGTLDVTGGITGTDAFTGADTTGPIDHGETTPFTGTAEANTGYQTITFAGPGNTIVNAATNGTNTLGIYDSNDPNNQNNDGLGHYSGANGFVSVAVTGGTTTFAANTQYSGATTVSGGTLILGNLANGATPTARTLSSLAVSGGQTQMAAGGASGGSANGGRNLLVLTGVPVPNSNPATPPTPVAPLTVSGTGLIDLTNNDMIVQNVGSSGLSQITTLINQGYNGGHWNGTTGITSTTAAGLNNTALGVELNSTAGGAVLLSTFDGVSVANTDVLVKYTYYGDANLDGVVNGNDYTLVDNGFNNHLTGWNNGDFNYDGVVNGDDYTLIDNAFNTQSGPLVVGVPAEMVASNTAQVAGSSATAVPEPATLGLFALSTFGLLTRRRRAR